MKLINHNVLEPNQASSMSSLLDELFQVKGKEAFQQFTPVVDIYEEDQHYGLALALAGVKKEDIQINLADNKLRISGERKTEMKNKDKKFYVQEIHKGNFSKTFPIPKDVNQEKIEAKFEDGLLSLLLHKKQKLQIEIK